MILDAQRGIFIPVRSTLKNSLTMVPNFGWIVVSLCTTLTAIEVYWDASRRIYQQIDQNKTDPVRQKDPFLPSWSWARMCSQILLCLLNIWISITAYHTKHFWALLSISVIALFMIMQLKKVKSNALYLVCFALNIFVFHANFMYDFTSSN